MFHYSSFLSLCLYIYGDLFKVILTLYLCIALWDIYYVHLVWEDIENDLKKDNGFFSNLFSKFYKCFGHGFSMEVTNSVDEANS